MKLMFGVDSKAVCLIGGTVSAILAGVYVVFGPPKNRRKPARLTTSGICPGLVNLGNSCFLNAILQALAPCTSVIHWLSHFVTQRQDHSGRYLASTLNKVLGVLNNSSIEYTEEYCPSDVINALQRRRWHIPQTEQDAHELFHVLTETLDEESTKCGSVLSLFDVEQLQEKGDERLYQSDVDARSRIDAQLITLPRKGSDHPFRGLLASQLKCSSCFYKYPVKYDTFDSLSLNLPENYMGMMTVDHLLRQFIMSEVVQNVECFGCTKKRGLGPDSGHIARSSFIKKMTIGKLPQCLCLHVQRTVWLNNGMPMKRFEHVNFPEILNMGEYVYLRSETKKKSMFLPLSMDNDIGSRLVGGKKNGITRMGCRPPSPTSPTVSTPYSGPVNLLKALNYHTRTTMSGLLAGTTTDPINQTNSNVQRLAQAYSTESFSPINTNHAYKLSAVIVHLGDVFSGHFVTYRRVPSTNGQRFPDRWLYTSDTLVKKATIAEVLQANAYMLFYEKI